LKSSAEIVRINLADGDRLAPGNYAEVRCATPRFASYVSSTTTVMRNSKYAVRYYTP
jgi:hypothetical protein